MDCKNDNSFGANILKDNMTSLHRKGVILLFYVKNSDFGFLNAKCPCDVIFFKTS